ncbi:hypothetical protein Htur_3851 (plasmid) [Haloterrigena turkmenica DSM 5511]|uniref:Uncharacterized protein n=1 Tax=Haloterrigena turkmenica (strain ATCC 51198 / DSM 5511 / JCM 9101 / NCIMB 13204 / VKM B-1734 / 4k) TaxID=543526 RepID=D2S013_HALTV|nr:hypothetical protein [Haloterrigena turkmenica]ADB62710.1 hypothetical protein Htur_3851 [Haloterrigena turkmenica DSM 5511]
MATLAEFAVYALIGLFATNAIPHVVRGITGRRHMTPFGSDSSAALNVLWGSANAAVAGTLAWTFRDAAEEVYLGRRVRRRRGASHRTGVVLER